MENWGERLKEERERLGLSQAAFAERCCVGRTAQYNYEREEREPGLLYLKRAEVLGVDLLYVFSGVRKGDEWLYARAHKRVLDNVNEQFGLDRQLLATAIQSAVNLDVAVDSRESAIIETWTDALRSSVAEWFATGKNPDRLIDLELLSTIIQRVYVAADRHSLAPSKQAKIVATLYRAFKVSGAVDVSLVESTVALASD